MSQYSRKLVNQLLEAGDNLCVFSGILQVELAILVPEVVIVEACQCGVFQLCKDSLGVGSSDSGYSVGTAEVSSQLL